MPPNPNWSEHQLINSLQTSKPWVLWIIKTKHMWWAGGLKWGLRDTSNTQLSASHRPTSFLDTWTTAWISAPSCPTLCDPMDYSPQGSSVHGIFQARYGSGLLFPSPGDLPNPAAELASPALQADSLPLSRWGAPWTIAVASKLSS